MATQSIRNFYQATGRNLGGLAANPAFAPRMQPTSPAPMMGPPPPSAQPSGKLVPGRSGGSMVWQPDAAPVSAPAPEPMPTADTPAPSFSSNSSGMSPLDGDMGLGRPLGSPAPSPAPAPSFGSNSSGMSPLDGNMGLGKPLEFGGAFANGGIAPAGKVSLVGERGPEMIVPMGPTAVIPMRAAPMMTPDYSLNSPPRAVGRSMNDPQRMNEIAMRRMRSQGNYEGAAKLAQSQQWLNARFGGRNAVPSATAMRAAVMPMSLPQPPMPPAGRLVPGRSAGSMVWQPDAAPMTAPAPEPIPTPMMSPMRQPEQPAADAMPVPDLTINPLTGLPFALATPNVPSGFMAQQAQVQNATFPGLAPAPPGLYTEAPPPFRITQVGQMDVITDSSGKQVGSYKREAPPQPLTMDPLPNTNIMVPRGEGADRIPLMENRGTIESPRPSADTMGPMPGMMDLRVLDQTPNAPRAPTVRRILVGNQEVDAQWNAQTNRWEPVAMAGGAATSADAGGAMGAAGTSPLDKLRALRSRTGGQL